MPHQKSPFKLACRLAFPVVLSYGSVGLVFGILFSHLHEPWYAAFLMSLFAYSGAVQFVVIGLMAQGASLPLMFFSTIFIAARNIFYGLSLLERYQLPPWQRWFLIFTLVDTSYAVTVNTKPYHDSQHDRMFCLTLNSLMLLAWVVGTLFGSVVPQTLFNFANLEFVLVAFFAIFVFEKFMQNRSAKPILIACVTFALSYGFLPQSLVLLGAILMSTVIFLLLPYLNGGDNELA